METAQHSILPEALEVTECAQPLHLTTINGDPTTHRISPVDMYARWTLSISKPAPGAPTAAGVSRERLVARTAASGQASITAALPSPLYCVLALIYKLISASVRTRPLLT